MAARSLSTVFCKQTTKWFCRALFRQQPPCRSLSARLVSLCSTVFNHKRLQLSPNARSLVLSCRPYQIQYQCYYQQHETAHLLTGTATITYKAQLRAQWQPLTTLYHCLQLYQPEDLSPASLQTRFSHLLTGHDMIARLACRVHQKMVNSSCRQARYAGYSFI